MKEKYNELLGRLREIDDINMAVAVLGWDQTTYMPAGGGEARGRQLADPGPAVAGEICRHGDGAAAG